MKLIVEMEMPQRCAECDIVQKTKSGYRCPIASKTHGFSCVAGRGQLERPHYCPIDGVLPETHGDLIDRDALYMAVKSHDTSDAAIARNHNRVTSLQNISTMRKGYIAEKHICLDDIIRAEAVIKAERKDDEQI